MIVITVQTTVASQKERNLANELLALLNGKTWIRFTVKHFSATSIILGISVLRNAVLQVKSSSNIDVVHMLNVNRSHAIENLSARLLRNV